VLGVIGRSGRNLKQFSGAHALACPSENENLRRREPPIGAYRRCSCIRGRSRKGSGVAAWNLSPLAGDGRECALARIPGEAASPRGLSVASEPEGRSPSPRPSPRKREEGEKKRSWPLLKNPACPPAGSETGSCRSDRRCSRRTPFPASGSAPCASAGSCEAAR